MKTLKLLCSLAFITPLFQSEAVAQTLRPSSNGRYIEFSNGTPVFLLSDTAWMLGPSYTQTEVVNHANTRKTQGFVAIQFSAVMPSLHPITQAFTSGDFSRPVASYWTAMDAKVKAITDTGLIAIVTPFWLKSDDGSTEAALNANSDAKCLAYGRFFGTRYRSNPRVAYFLGGDARPNRFYDNTSRLNNMGLGIDQVYAEAGLPKPIITYHSAPGVFSRESFPTASWLNLNWTYSYSEPLGGAGDANYFENWSAYARTPAMPVMHGEGWYDRDNGATTSSRWGNRHVLRRQGWHCVLAGSIAGFAYGAEPIWLDGYNGITAATAATWNSGKDTVRMKTILYTTQWWRLRPDTTASFISGSVGTGIERAIGATADDGSFGMAYTPVAKTFSLRMPGTGRTFTLTWHDPASGATRAITTAASGATVTVTTPGTNSSGQQDWVVIASSSGGGNISPTVSLTSPSNGATFATGANITLNATAADSDGTVTQVAFYRGTTLIGTDTSSPYSVTWSGAAAGTYSLTAVATDDDGATTTSSAASITVGTVPQGTTIQGEAAVIAGGVTVDNNNAGFFGTGFLNFPTTGGSAQFNSVNGGTGGSKTIAIRFANGSTTAASRTGRILVNGVAQSITFTSDQNWTNWRTLNVTATFNASTANTIRLESTGQDLGNIDQITIP